MTKLASLVVVLAVSGCTVFGESKPETDPAASESASTPVDGAKVPTPGSAPTPGGTGPDLDPGSGPPTGGGIKMVKSGVISLMQSTNFWSASASFAETRVDEVDAHDCEISAEGSCSIITCNIGGVPLMPMNAPHAGEISIAAEQNLVLVPNADGVYAARSGVTTKLYAPGSDLLVAATGGPAPAFERTFKAPTPVTVTSPVWPQLGALTVDRTKPLLFEWSGGGQGLVNVVLSSVVDGVATQVTCKFFADDGTGAVSTVALQKLPVDTGRIVVSSMTADNVEQDGWNITLQATWPSKNEAASFK